MNVLSILLFGIVVIVTHFIEGITGFGSTVLAMPFGIMLVGLKTSKLILALFALLLCLYVVVISYKKIKWKEFLTIIIFMVLGMPVGLWIFDSFSEKMLKIILGIFMFLIASRGIFLSFKPDKQLIKFSNPVLYFVLFLAGCIHGAFASGGPLLIIYASEKLKEKSEFRATLCLVWVVLNSIITFKSLFSGTFTPEINMTILYLLPFLIVGTLLGNWAHYKIKDKYFTRFVYGILFISSFFMFI